MSSQQNLFSSITQTHQHSHTQWLTQTHGVHSKWPNYENMPKNKVLRPMRKQNGEKNKTKNKTEKTKRYRMMRKSDPLHIYFNEEEISFHWLQSYCFTVFKVMLLFTYGVEVLGSSVSITWLLCKKLAEGKWTRNVFIIPLQLHAQCPWAELKLHLGTN